MFCCGIKDLNCCLVADEKMNIIDNYLCFSYLVYNIILFEF